MWSMPRRSRCAPSVPTNGSGYRPQDSSGLHLTTSPRCLAQVVDRVQCPSTAGNLLEQPHEGSLLLRCQCAQHVRLNVPQRLLALLPHDACCLSAGCGR